MINTHTIRNLNAVVEQRCAHDPKFQQKQPNKLVKQHHARYLQGGQSSAVRTYIRIRPVRYALVPLRPADITQ